jgi:hypothetical protein
MNELYNKIEEQLKQKDVIQHIYHSTSQICKVLSIIIRSNGDEWINELKPLFPDKEHTEFVKKMKPYILSIRQFFAGKKHSGGAIESDALANAAKVALPGVPALPDVAGVADAAKAALPDVPVLPGVPGVADAAKGIADAAKGVAENNNIAAEIKKRAENRVANAAESAKEIAEKTQKYTANAEKKKITKGENELRRKKQLERTLKIREAERKARLEAGETDGNPAEEGIDSLYKSFFDKLDSITAQAKKFASNYGILKYQQEYDEKEDIQIVPEVLISMSDPTGVSPTSMSLRKIKVPMRTLIFAVYLFLDVIRISSSATGSDSQRKLLSIVVALFDLLKGDWQKALMSFAGYYSTSSMLLGELLKIYFTLFQSISPRFQQSLVYGSLDAAKSLMVGLLLQVYQIVAPYDQRIIMIEGFKQIKENKERIDKVLTDNDLPAQADEFVPTMDDFNNLQFIMDDPNYVCSQQVEELVTEINNSPIINFIIEDILRIPTTEHMKKYKGCPDTPQSYEDMLVHSQTNLLEKKNEVGAVNAVESAVNPTATNTPDTTAATNTTALNPGVGVGDIAGSMDALKGLAGSKLSEGDLHKAEESKEESKEESNDEKKEEPGAAAPNAVGGKRRLRYKSAH